MNNQRCVGFIFM